MFGWRLLSKKYIYNKDKIKYHLCDVNHDKEKMTHVSATKPSAHTLIFDSLDKETRA